MYILVTITFLYFPNNELNIKISSKKIKRSYEWHGHLIMHFYYTNKNTYLFLPGKCIPLAPQAPKYVISSPRIEEQKQFMKYYALVGKFLGLWPSERDLIRWIQYWWKPKGHYELQLGSKGFFTIIFYILEDRNRIFDGGPYFFNSAGLFLRFWTEKFSPEKEYFAHAPVWIRLYSLPQKFWLKEVLAGIGNTIGLYVKSSEATKQR
jgi:hypothetical protein